MAQPRRVIRYIITAAIFIFMEVAAVNMLSHNGITKKFLFARQRDMLMGLLWKADNAVVTYFSLKDVNRELSEENAMLYRLLRAERTDENRARLDSMARELSAPGGFEYMPAEIVKISRNKQHNYIILGQGAEDGVCPQSAIITAKGVIGIVDTVSRHHAYAVSLMNKDLNISARMGREGSVGPLSWDGRSSNGAVLREIPLQCRFSPGDTVFTSGHSSIFPADIPLGIAGESKIINGATYEIDVTLFQGFNDVRHVMVATNTGRREIQELEAKMEN